MPFTGAALPKSRLGLEIGLAHMITYTSAGYSQGRIILIHLPLGLAF